MRIYLSAAILLGLLAGCSADQDSSTSKTTASASSTLQQGATSQFAGRSAMTGFASLPDRGELLAYNQTRGVKHSGAYTAYPVALSEAHALDAMRTGEMVVKAPNGELIRLKYERHIEHPDGNWTWIGRNADGADAVLTFGEKAVFGTIPQGVADTLRLTMRAGQSFLVATDRSKLSGLDGAVRRSGTDQLIPPRLAAATSVRNTASMMQTEAVGTQSASAASAQLIDVLLGYTNGFATQLGGDSQAITRLVNLTDITNQAYANSGVTMRVRLVGTLKVTYPDNTDNGDALEKLTGYKSGTGGGPITPDPAFSALRAKRDELGADLVSLVRAFRTPENNGCGIAWLIGGGGFAIETADAPFGYSVVSDGTDRDEGDGKSYFCRLETLAHELGHNMGQAHNTEDASSGGTHPYSYGYRESTTGGFYTIMAYPKKDAGQFSIGYFANPGVQYDGRPTGVANQSDNVRSLNLSMPFVATFRTTVIPEPSTLGPILSGDIDADGKSDLLWFNPTTRELYYWLMNGGAVRLGRGGVLAPPNASPRGLADFSGDGRADILLPSGQDIWIYLGNTSGAFTSVYFAPYPIGWDLVGVGDVDGDNKQDLVWYNPTTREIYYWLLNGTSIRLGRGGTFLPSGATPRALGDLNGDGRADIVVASGQGVSVYLATSGGSFTTSSIAPYPAGWNLVGTADIDGDGKRDIVWYQPNTRELYYWLMNGAQIRLGQGGVLAPPATAPRALADFSGDGRADILLPSSGDIWTYLGNTSGTFTSAYTSPYPTGWQ